MDFNTDGLHDPFEAAAEAAHAEFLADSAEGVEDDFLAHDPRNIDTREWNGEDE